MTPPAAISLRRRWSGGVIWWWPSRPGAGVQLWPARYASCWSNCYRPSMGSSSTPWPGPERRRGLPAGDIARALLSLHDPVLARCGVTETPEPRVALVAHGGGAPRRVEPPLTLCLGAEREGVGPDGVTHTRFRTWKEALRDAG